MIKSRQRVRLVQKTKLVSTTDIGIVSKLEKGGLVIVDFPQALVTALESDLVCAECDHTLGV